MGNRDACGTFCGCTFVARYRLTRYIDSGGMGEVYEAWDERLNRKVAVKLLPPHLIQPGADQVRFKQTAELVARLKHSHILDVLDSGEDNGVAFIVMPLVDGWTIDRRVDSRPQREIVDLVCQVADALHYAHSEGVVHRDVKPSNILCDKHGCVYLTDFGIARPLVYPQRLTAPHQILGTAEYLSPEQLRGEEAGPASDQYALSVVLYQLLSGKVPFEGSWHEVTQQHLYAAPVPLHQINPDVGERLSAVVLKGLSKNPADRYVTLEEFKRAALAAFRSDEAGEENAVAVGQETATVQLPTDHMSPGLRGPTEPNPLPWHEAVRAALRPTMDHMRWVVREITPRVLEQWFRWSWNPLLGFWYWLVDLRKAVQAGEWRAMAWAGVRGFVAMSMLALLYAWLFDKLQATLFSPVAVGLLGLSLVGYIWLNRPDYIQYVSATSRKESDFDGMTSLWLFVAGLPAPLLFALLFFWRLHGYDSGGGGLQFLIRAALLALAVIALALGRNLYETRQRLNALVAFVAALVFGLVMAPDLSIPWTALLTGIVLLNVWTAGWYADFQRRREAVPQRAYYEPSMSTVP